MLHRELLNKIYRHGGYQAFKINDPKPRDIHKANIRDRLVHHAIYKILYPYFDRKFIYDSYSCRIGKGTHRAMNRFRNFSWKVSKNNTLTIWILKCDIRKFFASIDHNILENILAKYIDDSDTLWLLGQIIGSFNSENFRGVGLPLGNLTSQLLVNIYMNEFDQFIKRKLKIKYYIRYADDFVFMSENRNLLKNILSEIKNFLRSKLKIRPHPDKVYIKTLASGIDFLGWIHFPDHRILRNATKWRMYRKLSEHPTNKTYQSYKGLLEHGNTWKIERKLERLYIKTNRNIGKYSKI